MSEYLMITHELQKTRFLARKAEKDRHRSPEYAHNGNLAVRSHLHPGPSRTARS